MPRIVCPQCGKAATVPAPYLGRQVRCNGCKAPFKAIADAAGTQEVVLAELWEDTPRQNVKEQLIPQAAEETAVRVPLVPLPPPIGVPETKRIASIPVLDAQAVKAAPTKLIRPVVRQEDSLLRRTTCPHCWHTFPLENVLWVSTHSDLIGDPLLGPYQQQRFLPTRFNLEGNALDAHGLPCLNLACPHCHQGVPRALMEMEPFFVSIFGAPGCGKSYLLAAMTWQLRQLLPRDFAVRFQDLDLMANGLLNEYVESLFGNSNPDSLAPLENLILKTDVTGGQLYSSVKYGNQEVSYPRPFLFTLSPTDQHPNAEARQQLARLLCLYDNAGEHFQPGMDSHKSQVTRHLAQSRVLLFLFDPTQDRRFRERCKGHNAELSGAKVVDSRQEVVLLEAINRIRSLTNLSQSARHPHPLIVLVTKYDVWAPLLGAVLTDNPWKTTARGISALDAEQIVEYSRKVQRLLADTCPELVHAAEGFSQNVVYLPISALGCKPLVDPVTGRLAVRPRNLTPIWALVPLLYGISQSLKGLIPVLRPPPACGRDAMIGGKGSAAPNVREGGK